MTPASAAFLLPLLLAAAAVAQGDVLAGRVLTRDGERAAGASLRLRWRMAPELPGLCGISLGDNGLAEFAAAADERGAFSVTLPHRGPFEVVAEHGGDRSTPRHPVMAGAFVELRLQAPVVVVGVVVDGEGAPLAKAKVALVPKFTAWSKLAAYRLPEWRGRTATDEQGRFELPFHDAYLREPRWEPFLVLDVDAPGLAARNLELLRPTQHCRELVLQMVPAAKAHPRAPGTAPRPAAASAAAPAAATPVRLRVQLQQSGRALADAPVLWSRLRRDGPPQETNARTDAAGEAVLPATAPDGTVLGFVAVAGTWLPFARVRVAGADVDLGTVPVVARALTGQVLDSTGQPVAGARVAALATAALDDELPCITFSDHGGRFQFMALPSEPLRVWADCGRHGFASAPMAADQRNVELRTVAAGEITGTVLDADGKPCPGAWLVLARQGNDLDLMPGLRPGSTFVCVHSDGDGRVVVRGLPAGTWQVIGNLVRDGRLLGGSTEVALGGDFTLSLRLLRE